MELDFWIRLFKWGFPFFCPAFISEQFLLQHGAAISTKDFRVSNFSEEIPFGLGYWDSTSHRIPLPCGKVVDSQSPKVLWTVVSQCRKGPFKRSKQLTLGFGAYNNAIVPSLGVVDF